MYRKIIVGHDLHQGGDDALALGSLLAETSGAKLVVAGVFPFGELPRGFEAEWREREEQIASEIQAIAFMAGAEAEAFPSSSPARGLHDLAQEIGADLIVVGASRHSKLGEILAGNVGLGLLHGSPAAVAIAPRGYAKHPAKLETIVVGIDGGEESSSALAHAIELAEASAARLNLVAVAEAPTTLYGSPASYAALQDAIEDRGREQLAEALESVDGRARTQGSLISGVAAQKLAEAAAGADLLALGSRGYGPVRRVLLGSVSSALVRKAPCPVLVHPRGTAEPIATPSAAKSASAR